MLELIKERLEKINEERIRVLVLREELQLLLLKIIYDLGYFGNLAFVGGTALRFLFDLRRFSEDIDFSLANNKGYNFEKLVNKIMFQLKKYKLQTDLKVNKLKTVQSAMFKFKELLNTFNLTRTKGQKLSIKMEIDTNPPKDWCLEISLVSRSQIFSVTHYDLPSLYATKLHSCFFRKFVKGRDFYDLIWYLGRGVAPNFKLLNNAIYQTEHSNPDIKQDNFKDFLNRNLEKIDFSKVRADVEKFLEDSKEAELLKKDLVLSLVKKLK